MSITDRVSMIDPQSNEVPVTKQCEWLDLNRSTYDHQKTIR